MPTNLKEIVQTVIIDSTEPESITNEEVGNILNQIIELTNVPNGALVIIYKGKQNDVANTGNALQVNDYVRGQLPGGPYWDRAIYNGGDPAVIGSYTNISIQGPTGPQGPIGPASTVPGPTGPQGPQGPSAVAKTKADLIGASTSPAEGRTILSADINNLLVETNGLSHFALPDTTEYGKEVIVINDTIYNTTVHTISGVIIRLNYSVILNGTPYISSQVDIKQGRRYKFTYLIDDTWDMEEYFTPSVPTCDNVTPGEASPTYAIPNVGNINGSSISLCNPLNSNNSYVKLRDNPSLNGFKIGDSVIVYNTSGTVDLNMIYSNIYHYYLNGTASNIPYVIPPLSAVRFTLGPSSFYWIAEKITP